MQIVQQVALFVENRPGTLGRICRALAEARINIFAISVSDTVDHSVVRLVLSDPAKAARLFEEYGSLAVETEVLMLDADNKPGTLATISEKLAAAKINIEYAYSATSPNARNGLLILRVSNPRKAMKILNS